MDGSDHCYGCFVVDGLQKDGSDHCYGCFRADVCAHCLGWSVSQSGQRGFTTYSSSNPASRLRQQVILFWKVCDPLDAVSFAGVSVGVLLEDCMKGDGDNNTEAGKEREKFCKTMESFLR